MLLLIVALVIGTPILWAISVGAVRELRQAREADPRVGCQAWVSVRGLLGRRYRCAEPLDPGGQWCRRHEVEHARGTLTQPGKATFVDEPQTVGRALVQARIGIPAAIVVLALIVVVGVWAATALA